MGKRVEEQLEVGLVNVDEGLHVCIIGLLALTDRLLLLLLLAGVPQPRDHRIEGLLLPLLVRGRKLLVIGGGSSGGADLPGSLYHSVQVHHTLGSAAVGDWTGQDWSCLDATGLDTIRLDVTGLNLA